VPDTDAHPRDADARVPVALGLAGLLPFLAAGAGAVLLAPPAGAAAAVVAAVYGAVILSFLGGVQWGFGLKGGGPAAFLWAVTPSLVVFLAAFLPLPLMLAVLSAGFVLAGAVDVTVFSRTGPRWYVRLRIGLTVVVTVVLAVTAAVAPSDRALIALGPLLSAG
jgi:hypothetical protein